MPDFVKTGSPLRCAAAFGQCHRDEVERGDERGHQDRAQTGECAVRDGFLERPTGLSQPVEKGKHKLSLCGNG